MFVFTIYPVLCLANEKGLKFIKRKCKNHSLQVIKLTAIIYDTKNKLFVFFAIQTWFLRCVENTED